MTKNDEVGTRVDAMGDSTDNPTAAQAGGVVSGFRRHDDSDCERCWQSDCECVCATCEAARRWRSTKAEAK